MTYAVRVTKIVTELVGDGSSRIQAGKEASRAHPRAVEEFERPAVGTLSAESVSNTEVAMGVVKEFREFAVRGNVVDMAVGIIIGASFGTVVKSFVDDVLMPPLGMLVGNVDFGDKMWVLREGSTPGPYQTLAAAKDAGAVTLNVGMFINAVVSFIIVAFAVFVLVRAINRLKRKEEVGPAPAPTTKDCPFCASSIPLKASRCPFCTSELEAA